MKTKRVLFITQEIFPYIEEGDYKMLGRKVPQFFLERVLNIFPSRCKKF